MKNIVRFKKKTRSINSKTIGTINMHVRRCVFSLHGKVFIIYSDVIIVADIELCSTGKGGTTSTGQACIINIGYTIFIELVLKKSEHFNNVR